VNKNFVRFKLHFSFNYHCSYVYGFNSTSFLFPGVSRDSYNTQEKKKSNSAKSRIDTHTTPWEVPSVYHTANAHT